MVWYIINEQVNENKEFVQMRTLIAELQQKENEYKARIEQLEKVLRHQSNSLPEVPVVEELERHVTHMEQELENKEKQLAAFEHYLAAKEEECSAMKLDLETIQEENARLKSDVNDTIDRDRESNLEKLEQVGRELQQALEANKRLVEDINRERVLRKKYFNTIEDLKGKIRVYCRLRPLTSVEQRIQHSVADVIDPYTLVINTPKGPKEFHFDRVFLPEDTQETVFEDTHVNDPVSIDWPCCMFHLRVISLVGRLLSSRRSMDTMFAFALTGRRAAERRTRS